VSDDGPLAPILQELSAGGAPPPVLELTGADARAAGALR